MYIYLRAVVRSVWHLCVSGPLRHIFSRSKNPVALKQWSTDASDVWIGKIKWSTAVLAPRSFLFLQYQAAHRNHLPPYSVVLSDLFVPENHRKKISCLLVRKLQVLPSLLTGFSVCFWPLIPDCMSETREIYRFLSCPPWWWSHSELWIKLVKVSICQGKIKSLKQPQCDYVVWHK